MVLLLFVIIVTKIGVNGGVAKYTENLNQSPRVYLECRPNNYRCPSVITHLVKDARVRCPPGRIEC